MTETIDERLRKLSKEFDKLLGKTEEQSTERNIDRLIHFGLTLNEAKSWLKQEPNYVPSDESKHDDESDGEVTEPDTLSKRYQYEYFLLYYIAHKLFPKR